jgi:RNA polymerase sigma-70 factor (ECF subfamily)
MEEREAVARLKRGDIGGLDVLVKLYYTRAVKSAYLVVGDKDQAEDVVQSAFVNAYERIGSFDESRSFGPWFFQSVVRAAMRIPAGRRELSLELFTAENELNIPDPDPAVETLFEALETREEVLNALKKLSKVQRAAIVMRYYLDLSDAEVSRQLQVPEGTVRRRLHDARKRLLRLLPI